MKTPSLTASKGKEKYLAAFLLGFTAFVLVILPIIIYNGGYYIYYGDYNSQQIPFYNHAHEFIKNEGVGWDWGTDLGANFVGSYSFYLLGSPFFWLTIPLPQGLVTFSMPLLLALKFGTASMTAYAFIRRFVRSKNAALIGGMLYAFSGFQTFNIFFNHFHDVTAFFPLMLIAMEERINNNRRGVFALSVALMGIINYFFFTGQAVFLIIYLLARLKSPDFNINWKKFFSLAAEAVIGVMIACVMLIPSALAILENYRINERLYGLDLIAYNDKTRRISANVFNGGRYRFYKIKKKALGKKNYYRVRSMRVHSYTKQCVLYLQQLILCTLVLYAYTNYGYDDSSGAGRPFD